MRLVLSILLLAVVALLMDSHKTQVNDAYNRGHIDGVASVKQPNLDAACIAWWFDSNIKESKKRMCKK